MTGARAGTSPGLAQRAAASRNGGFPPLLIDPIDFVALFRQRLAEAQQAAQRLGGQLA